jgi:hypothetical protein
MSDPTMQLLINKEQYDFLKEYKEQLAMQAATGMLSNLDPTWIKGAANIYSLIYNLPKPNTNCRSCIVQFVRPLYYQLQKYEQDVRG